MSRHATMQAATVAGWRRVATSGFRARRTTCVGYWLPSLSESAVASHGESDRSLACAKARCLESARWTLHAPQVGAGLEDGEKVGTARADEVQDDRRLRHVEAPRSLRVTSIVGNERTARGSLIAGTVGPMDRVENA